MNLANFSDNPVWRCWLLTLALCLPGVLLAQQDDDTASQPDAAQAAEQARVEALSEAVRSQQQRLTEQQSEQGIYGPGLIETYSDLGALAVALDDPDAALAHYNNALQVARINSGLNSEQQLPIIQSLIAVREGVGDWEQVDDLQHLRLHIASRLHAPGDPAFVQAMTHYGEWKLRLIQENLLGQRSFGLMSAAEDLSERYEATLLAAQASPESAATPALAELLIGKGRADLAIARAVAGTPYTAFTGTARRYIQQTRCRNVTNAQGQLVRECYQVRVENPRYRQSQREAKRNALGRYQGEIHDSLEQLRSLHASDTSLAGDERQQLQAQIDELQTALDSVRRSSRGISLF